MQGHSIYPEQTTACQHFQFGSVCNQKQHDSLNYSAILVDKNAVPVLDFLVQFNFDISSACKKPGKAHEQKVSPEIHDKIPEIKIIGMEA